MSHYNGFPGEQRQRAQSWLNRQWNSGALARPSRCCACGQTAGKIHAHAEDYSEPFGPHTHEYHLCFLCHMVLHCRFRNREAWHRYCAAIASGAVFEPANSFGEVVAFMNGRERKIVMGERPRLLVLDAIERGGAPSTVSPRRAPVAILVNEGARVAEPPAGQLGLFGNAKSSSTRS